MKTNPNTCSRCPHAILDIGEGVMFCPCEDCHVGGLVQGREPFAFAPAIDPEVTPCDETCIKPAGHKGFHQRTAIAPQPVAAKPKAKAAKAKPSSSGFDAGFDDFIG